MLFLSPFRVLSHAVYSVIPCSLALSCLANAQTPGQQTSNPFPNAIPVGMTLGVRDFATLPNSGGAKARMNSDAVAPDGRFFIADQRGPIYSLSAGGAATAFIDLSTLGLELLNDNGERGLGQIAFHPQFDLAGTPGYGKFYVAFSTSNTTPTPDYAISGAARTHDEVIYEFTTANPAAATYTAASTPRQVLRVAEPATNHNGDGLAFNPTAAVGSADYGALYYSLGDGGGGGDPFGSGQNKSSPLGAILRINPLGTNGLGGDHGIVADNVFASDNNAATLAENYAVGLRNPQRFSWDRATGKMYIGDIGQGTVEEIDVGVNGGNYGWNQREGSFTYINGNTVAYPPSPDNSGFINPIAEYDHSEGISITGGFVYRGSAIPQLQGKYVFGDLAQGRIFYIDANQPIGGGQDVIRELLLSEDGGATSESLLQLINQTPGVSAGRADLRFGEDAAGNLYVLNKQDGIVRLLTNVPEPMSFAIVALISLATLRRRREA